MALPNFLCIGAQKAGTSWLHQNLREHPDIWMPPIKELQFFSHMFVEQHRAWTGWHIRSSVNRLIGDHLKQTPTMQTNYGHLRYLVNIASQDVFTESWYRRIFERPAANGKVTGEITPEYSTIPMDGIHYVQELLGNVKIIYMVRDPVDRALSQLRMNCSRQKKSPETDAEWIELASAWEIGNRGDYARYVPRWKSVFPESHLLFLPYGMIASEPADLMRDVECFLDIPQFENYTSLRTRVHAGASMNVPGSVQDFLAQQLEPQRRFIQSEFGERFAALTRGQPASALEQPDLAR